jgi:hypothetical protein
MNFTVTIEQVRNIIVNTELEDSQIEGCISTATVILLENFGSSGLSNILLTEIGMYLAAHFVALRDQTTKIKSEKIGDARVEYDIDKTTVDTGDLRYTTWGATALLLDTSGILKGLGLKQPRLIALNELG